MKETLTFLPGVLVIILVRIEHLDGVFVLIDFGEAIVDVGTLEWIDILN